MGQKWEEVDSWKSRPSTLSHNCSQPHFLSRIGKMFCNIWYNQYVFSNLQPFNSTGRAKRNVSLQVLAEPLEVLKKKTLLHQVWKLWIKSQLWQSCLSPTCCYNNMQAGLGHSAVSFHNQRLLVHAWGVICGLHMATVNQTRREYQFRAMRKGRERERAGERLWGSLKRVWDGEFHHYHSKLAMWNLCKKTFLGFLMWASSNRKNLRHSDP